MHGDPPSSPLALAARRHADEVVKPQVRDWEAAAAFPRDAAVAAAGDGLLGLFAPGTVGGQGASLAEAMDVFEELGRGDAAYAFALSMHNAVANTVARFGTPELSERYARGLATGELLGGFSLTEPHAGSDAAAITTQAVPVDDGWRVTGRKAWVSLAGEADIFVLVCRTGSERGTGDVLMLAVDARTDGVRVERLYDKAAGAFLPIGEVSYHEVHVPSYALLAPAGQGMRAALGAIDVARVDIAAIAVGLAAEALTVALEYARGREAFGGTLLDLQSIQFALADVETDVVAGRMLYRAAAAALDEGRGTVLAAHAKRFCPDAALRAAIACSEVLGAYGLLHEYPLARFIAHAKMLQIVDGTTEIQRIVIARDLARR
jgi:alkylation response protein AidB-like acyl-CoA dehydrogenase